MARAKKNTTVSVNFKGVQSRQLLPEDDYKVVVDEVNQEESSAGNDMLSFIFRVENVSKYDGQKLYYHCSLNTDALWKLHALLTALGVEVPDDELDIDLEELADGDHYLMAVVQHDTYDGTKRSKMMDFYAINEATTERPAKKTGKVEPVTEDMINEADEDQLQTFLVDHELEKEVDLEDYRTIRKKRAAVLEAFTDADKLDSGEKKDDVPEEMTPAQRRKARRDARKSRGETKAKLPQLAADEVQEMSEDELSDVVDKYGLKVDLDDYRTLRKKVAAVIDGLEEGDYLESD